MINQNSALVTTNHSCVSFRDPLVKFKSFPSNIQKHNTPNVQPQLLGILVSDRKYAADFAPDHQEALASQPPLHYFLGWDKRRKMDSRKVDALRRVAYYDAFLARHVDRVDADEDDGGKSGNGGDSGISWEFRMPKKAPRDTVSPTNIHWPISFCSSEGTVALGDLLVDAQVTADGTDERNTQTYQHAQFTDGRLNGNLVVSPKKLREYVAISRATALADEDNVSVGCLSSHGSFIIEGRHGPVVTQKPYPTKNKSSERRREKKRFQRFVAVKQNNRSGSLRPMTQHNLDETPTSETTSTKTLVRESPTSTIIMVRESPTSTKTLVRESPTSFAGTSSYAEHSPTGVADFALASLTTCDSGCDEVPAMGRRIVKKQVFNFIRVEKYCNLKGIMKHDRHESKSKSLTWWDDRANRDKPFILKTDDSFDWDEDASYDFFAKSGWCSDQFQNLAGKVKRAKCSESDNDRDPPSNDESFFSVDRVDEFRRKIVGNSLEYYREGIRLKLEEFFDRTVKSVAEVERIASLLKLAPFSCNGG